MPCSAKCRSCCRYRRWCCCWQWPTKRGLMTNVKWMSTILYMGGQRMKTGGSVWWHGEGVGGIIEWHGRWKHGVQRWGLFWTWKAWKWVKWWGNDAETMSNIAC
jgi:hypothetical protein